MNEKELRIVLKILTYADGGCPHCVNQLFEEFVDKFPSSIIIAKEIYKEEFEEEGEFTLRSKNG